MQQVTTMRNNGKRSNHAEGLERGSSVPVGVKKETGELGLLFEINQILGSDFDLRTVAEPVLETITRLMGTKSAALTLLL